MSKQSDEKQQSRRPHIPAVLTILVGAGLALQFGKSSSSDSSESALPAPPPASSASDVDAQSRMTDAQAVAAALPRPLFQERDSAPKLPSWFASRSSLDELLQEEAGAPPAPQAKFALDEFPTVTNSIAANPSGIPSTGPSPEAQASVKQPSNEQVSKEQTNAPYPIPVTELASRWGMNNAIVREENSSKIDWPDEQDIANPLLLNRTATATIPAPMRSNPFRLNAHTTAGQSEVPSHSTNGPPTTKRYGATLSRSTRPRSFVYQPSMRRRLAEQK